MTIASPSFFLGLYCPHRKEFVIGGAGDRGLEVLKTILVIVVLSTTAVEAVEVVSPLLARTTLLRVVFGMEGIPESSDSISSRLFLLGAAANGTTTGSAGCIPILARNGF